MSKKNLRDIGLLVIFFSMMIISSGYLYYINSPEQDKNKVVGGFIDLSDYNQKEITTLDGEWEYYPNVIIDPNDDFTQYESSKRLVHVPKTIVEDNLEDKTQGTYRLRIKIDDGAYGVKLRTVRYAYELFMNGQSTASLGLVSNDFKDVESDSKFKVGIGNALDNELEIVIHTKEANFNSSGIYSSIEFGKKDLIITKDLQSKMIELTFAIILFTLGIYYILTYIRRRDAIFLVYFGVMAISAAGILSLMSEQVIRDVIPFSYHSRIVLQVMLFWSFVAGAHYFVSKLYHQWANIKITNAINVFTLFVVILFFISTHVRGLITNSKIQYLVILSLLFSLTQIIYIMFNAYRNEARGYIYSTITIFMVINYSLLIVVKSFYSINLGYSQQMHFAIIIICATLLLDEYYSYDRDYALELKRSIDISDKNRNSFFKSLVNNVLAPLQNNIESMSNLVGDKTVEINPSVVNKIITIRNQSQEIVYMLNDISRLVSESDKFDSHTNNVNLKEVIKDGLAMFIATNDLEKREIMNKFDLDVEVSINVESFSTVLYQILKNSLDNTDRYGKIVLRGRVIDDFIFLYVEDNGKGIPKTDMPYIFDSFYKVDDSNPDRFGLGLTLAKETIENHGGIITLRSTEGAGTRVALGLPITLGVIEEVRDEKTDKNVSKHLGDEFNLMVITSNEKLLKELKPIYKNLFVYEYEKNEIESLSTEITKMNIDVLVLDYNSTVLLQEAVSRELRNIFESHELPMLLIAPQQTILDMWFHQQLYANDFIASPLDFNNLILKINNLYLTKLAVQSGIEKEFRYLHSQISPHFLYNTLNTIMGLSYVDVEKSREALLNLSVYLRAKMDVFSTDLLIPIEQELEIIEAYLNIEKLRFGDNIIIEINIEENLDFEVPSLLIQNIIENAFKHAFDLTKPDNKIIITIEKENNENIVKIQDNGKGIQQEILDSIYNQETDGFGFKNTFKRLSLIKNSDLKIDTNQNLGTTIIISIPEV